MQFILIMNWLCSIPLISFLFLVGRNLIEFLFDVGVSQKRIFVWFLTETPKGSYWVIRENKWVQMRIFEILKESC